MTVGYFKCLITDFLFNAGGVDNNRTRFVGLGRSDCARMLLKPFDAGVRIGGKHDEVAGGDCRFVQYPLDGIDKGGVQSLFARIVGKYRNAGGAIGPGKAAPDKTQANDAYTPWGFFWNVILRRHYALSPSMPEMTSRIALMRCMVSSNWSGVSA